MKRSSRERPQSRRWLLLVIILAICIALIKIHSAVTGRSTALDRAITTLSSPVVYVLVRIGGGVSSLRYIFAIPSILGENNRLQSENTLLSRESAEIALLRAENARLLAVQGVKSPDMKFRPLRSAVLARPYDLWVESVIIGATQGDGVAAGNLVANESGVVGVITEVQSTYSRVQLISSPQFRLGGIGGAELAEGVLVGSNGSSMIFDKVSNKAKISVGEKVFSRGQKRMQIFEKGSDGKSTTRLEGFDQPKGIFIGIVTGISKDESDFRQISVEPAANPSNLGYVVVYIK